MSGLSGTVGYWLEDVSYKALPALLKRDFGLVVTSRLKRGYVTDNKGRDIEVNIIGEGMREGTPVTIIGEAKSRLSKKGVDRFIERRLNWLSGVFAEIFPVLVTYMISEPDVQTYVKSKGVALYYSYDFE